MPNWVPTSIADGIATFRIDGWGTFFDFLEAEVFAGANPRDADYIWRGQRNSAWSLSSSLDRLFEKLGILSEGPDALEARTSAHLEAFKRAARGRRGPNPATLISPLEWWALGQHFGLATPLLDWTLSPFAAAYFAFEEISDASEQRIVYGLDRSAVRRRNFAIEEGPSFETGRVPILEIFEPMSDENQRLVSQGGLFTRGPIGMSVEFWVAKAFEGVAEPVLLRIEIPNADRNKCLRTLARMNISHLSLFPDLIGASRFSNLSLELDSEGEVSHG